MYTKSRSCAKILLVCELVKELILAMVLAFHQECSSASSLMRRKEQIRKLQKARANKTCIVRGIISNLFLYDAINILTWSKLKISVDMINVISSNVRAIGYDEPKSILFVRFYSNALYIYKGVPRQEFEGLKNASSVGSYLHRNIKNLYPYERIE